MFVYNMEARERLILVRLSNHQLKQKTNKKTPAQLTKHQILDSLSSKFGADFLTFLLEKMKQISCFSLALLSSLYFNLNCL